MYYFILRLPILLAKKADKIHWNITDKIHWNIADKIYWNIADKTVLYCTTYYDKQI